jgi:hypothetical protein
MNPSTLLPIHVKVVQGTTNKVTQQVRMESNQTIEVCPVLARSEIRPATHQNKKEDLLNYPRTNISRSLLAVLIGVLEALEDLLVGHRRAQEMAGKMGKGHARGQIVLVERDSVVELEQRLNGSHRVDGVGMFGLPTVIFELLDVVDLEGLEYSHRRCEGPPGNFHARYPKQTFLTVLVRNSLDLTRGKNRDHLKRLVKAYPGLATDLSNGILYYVYHEKMG